MKLNRHEAGCLVCFLCGLCAGLFTEFPLLTLFFLLCAPVVCLLTAK